jgi:hypothetical protein
MEMGFTGWRFEYSTCPVGVQHFWWIVHVVDCLTIIFIATYIFGEVVLAMSTPRGKTLAAAKKKNIPTVVVTMVEDDEVTTAVVKKEDATTAADEVERVADKVSSTGQDEVVSEGTRVQKEDELMNGNEDKKTR